MAECCGKVRGTKFCPNCEKRLIGDRSIEAFVACTTYHANSVSAAVSRARDDGWRIGSPTQRGCIVTRAECEDELAAIRAG